MALDYFDLGSFGDRFEVQIIKMLDCLCFYSTSNNLTYLRNFRFIQFLSENTLYIYYYVILYLLLYHLLIYIFSIVLLSFAIRCSIVNTKTLIVVARHEISFNSCESPALQGIRFEIWSLWQVTLKRIVFSEDNYKLIGNLITKSGKAIS